MTVEIEKKSGRKLFQPGNRASVGHGRPAVVRDFRERCRQFMEKPGGGWEQLADLASDPTSRDRFQALALIGAYAYGKPTQPIAGDEDRPPVRVSVTFDHAGTDPDQD